MRLIDSTPLGYGLPELERLLTEERPHLVGISANTPVYPTSLETARAAKRAAPGATVVLGGCHPTLYPERPLADPAVDAVVVGEGEMAMAEIAAALAEGRDLSGIAGVVHRRDGRLVHEAERPFWTTSTACRRRPSTSCRSASTASTWGWPEGRRR